MSLVDISSVKTVCSIGGGPIGAGWAAFFLSKGFLVKAYIHSEEEKADFRSMVDTAWISLEKLNDIDDMLSDLNNLKPESSEEKANGYIKIHSKGSSDEHQNQVRTCIDYIYQGEIFQANLSRLWRFKIQDNLSDVNIYKQLREKNPSPFAGIVRFNDSTIISSSPERLISPVTFKL